MTLGDVMAGNRDTFAIECHLEFETDTPSRNLAGRLWFWIGGSEVGNRDVISLPGIAANELRQTLRWCGSRVDSELYDADGGTVLTMVDEGLYSARAAAVVDTKGWERFLICMLPGGNEYMDGWLTVMVESPRPSLTSRDRIIYRGPAVGRDRDREIWLPSGTYKAVVEEFLCWFDARAN